MTEIGFTIIGIAIGYFWAMWRVDNIRLSNLTVEHKLDVKEFWRQAEAWRERQNKENH